MAEDVTKIPNELQTPNVKSEAGVTNLEDITLNSKLRQELTKKVKSELSSTLDKQDFEIDNAPNPTNQPKLEDDIKFSNGLDSDEELVVSINIDDFTSLNEEIDLGTSVVHDGDIKIKGLAESLNSTYDSDNYYQDTNGYCGDEAKIKGLAGTLDTYKEQEHDDTPKFIGNKIILGKKPAGSKLLELKAKCRQVKVSLKNWGKILDGCKMYCNLCKILFPNEVSLLYHQYKTHSTKGRHEETTSSNETYIIDTATECKFCNSSFSNRQNLARHCRNIHHVKVQVLPQCSPLYKAKCRILDAKNKIDEISDKRLRKPNKRFGKTSVLLPEIQHQNKFFVGSKPKEVSAKIQKDLANHEQNAQTSKTVTKSFNLDTKHTRKRPGQNSMIQNTSSTLTTAVDHSIKDNFKRPGPKSKTQNSKKKNEETLVKDFSITIDNNASLKSKIQNKNEQKPAAKKLIKNIATKPINSSDRNKTKLKQHSLKDDSKFKAKVRSKEQKSPVENDTTQDRESIKKTNKIKCKEENFCSHCNKIFPDKEAVITHLYDLLQQKKLTCQECKKQFDNDTKLDNHMLGHQIIKNSSKLFVKIKRMSSVEINNHIKKHKPEQRIDSNDSDEDVSYESDLVVDDANDDDVQLVLDDAPNPSDDDFRLACDDSKPLIIVNPNKNKAAHKTQKNIKSKESVNKTKSDTKHKTNKDDDFDFVVKNSELENLYYRCPICTAYFDEANLDRLEVHMKLLHGKEKGNYDPPSLQLYESNCGLCHQSSYRKKHSYNRHILLNHRFRDFKHIFAEIRKKDKPDGGEPKKKQNKTVSWRKMKKSLFAYTCKICNEKFCSEKNAQEHVKDKHDDAANAIKITNVLRASNHSLSLHVTLDNPPVPKGILFKCSKCNLHYSTCHAALTHHAKCPGPRKYWKCPICYRSFKHFNKEMHEKQHIYSEKFTVYETEDKETEMSKRVLSRCPKCGVYFAEIMFWKHYPHCNEPLDSFYCTFCDLLIDGHHKDTHKKAHNTVSPDDFILIEYEVPDKDATVPVNKKRKANVNDDEHFEEPQAKVAKTEIEEFNWNKQMLYCDNCSCYLHPYRPNNVAHFGKTCQDLPKTTCLDCGLTFTRRTMLSHYKVHKAGNEFSINKILFYDLNFNQTDPVIPALPRCPVCMVTFETIRVKIDHKCGDVQFKMCYYCRSDFTEKALKIHLPFHRYVDYKKKEPMTEMQKIMIKNQISKRSSGILFTMYKCTTCEVVITNAENVNEHKKQFFDCTKLKNLYRNCAVCSMTILGKEYAHHTARHKKNPKFVRENMNFITFDKSRRTVHKVYSTDEVMAEKEKYRFFRCDYCKVCLVSDHSIPNHVCGYSDRVWCPFCKIYLSSKVIKRHNAEHKQYFDMNSDNIVIVPFQALKKPKTVTKSVECVHQETESITGDDNENNPNKKDTVTSIDQPKEFILYKCQKCLVNYLNKNVDHDCENPGKKCEACNNAVSDCDYNKHVKMHEEEEISNVNIKLVPFEPLQKDMPVEKLYKCICGIHYITENGILDHFSSCGPRNKNSKQSCTKCGLIFTPSVLFNHFVTHHSKRAEFKYNIVELISYSSEERDTIFKCSKCELHFVVEKLLLNHLKECGTIPKASKRCGICYFEFHKNMLPLHIKKHHIVKKMKRDDLDVKIINDSTTKSLPKTDGDSHKGDENAAEDEVICEEPETPTIHIEDIEIDGEVIIPKVQQKKTADNLQFSEEHFQNVLYKCNECNLHYMHVRTIKEHVRGNHAVRNAIVVCRICNLRFTEFTLPRHEHIHHTTMKLKLEDLDIRDTYETPKLPSEYLPGSSCNQMSAKMMEKLKRRPFSKVLYRCNDCDIHFINYNSLLHHATASKHKLTNPPKKCDICNLNFSALSLFRHVYLHHTLHGLKQEDFDISDKLFAESKVGAYATNDYGDVNMKKYSNKLYKCSKCDIHFNMKASFIRHLVVANHDIKGAGPDKCIICGLTFLNLSLQRHKHFHHKLFGFKCTDDFIIEDESSVEDVLDIDNVTGAVTQKRINRGQGKLFKCKLCSLHYVKKSSCHRHMMPQHSETVSKSQCRTCSLHFTNRSLKLHRSLHHGKNNYTLEEILIEEYDFVDGSLTMKTYLASESAENKDNVKEGTSNFSSIEEQLPIDIKTEIESDDDIMEIAEDQDVKPNVEDLFVNKIEAEDV